MTEPSVSVLITTFNRRALLKLAMKSVLAQTYKNVKVIVYDDGSTDGTPEMMAKWQGDRVRYVRSDDNRGTAIGHNELFALADTEFSALLDSDDMYNIHKIELQVDAMLKLQPSYVGTGQLPVGKTTEHLWEQSPWLTWHRGRATPTILFRTKDALPRDHTIPFGEDRIWEADMALKYGIGVTLPLNLYHKDCRPPARLSRLMPLTESYKVHGKRISDACRERGLDCTHWRGMGDLVFPEMSFAPDGYVLSLLQRYGWHNTEGF